MNAISHENKKDLESCVGTCEQEEIKLLEDKPCGRLIYYFSPYFFKQVWIYDIIYPLYGAVLGLCVWLLYVALQDFYYGLGNTEWSYLIPPLWVTIHYILYFIMLFICYILDRRNMFIDTKVIEKLLGEVAEADLKGDPAAWRRIAFRVNQCFMSERYNNSIFYSGEQCRRFFVREFVERVKSVSFDDNTYHSGEIAMYCLEDTSKKKLVERAVANYNKSVEYFDEETDVDMGTEYCDGLFKRFAIIIEVSILCLGIAEMASFVVMDLVLLVFAIYKLF